MTVLDTFAFAGGTAHVAGRVGVGDVDSALCFWTGPGALTSIVNLREA